MPELDPGIHSSSVEAEYRGTEWIAGSSPAMTTWVGGSRVFLGSRGQAKVADKQDLLPQQELAI